MPFLYKRQDQRFMSTQSAVQSLGPQPANIALVRPLDLQLLLSQKKACMRAIVEATKVMTSLGLK